MRARAGHSELIDFRLEEYHSQCEDRSLDFGPSHMVSDGNQMYKDNGFMARNHQDCPPLHAHAAETTANDKDLGAVGVGGKYSASSEFVDYLDAMACPDPAPRDNPEPDSNLVGQVFRSAPSRQRDWAVYQQRTPRPTQGFSLHRDRELRRRLADEKPKWSQAVEMVCFQRIPMSEAARRLGLSDHKAVSYRVHKGLDLLLQWTSEPIPEETRHNS